MGEILSDGTIGGYEGYCEICRSVIKTNIQGNELGDHICLPRHASLFSGIGCADLAAEEIGYVNIFQVENDPFCQKVLNKNFPKTKKYSDIYEFDGSEYKGSIDVLTGGFPCQKYSHSGFRDGNEPLAKEMLRVIGEIMPTYVVAENVYGFFSIDHGKSIDEFCAALQDIGYEEPAILDLTSDFTGLQTVERHLWIVSKANEIRLQRNLEKTAQRIKRIKTQFQGSNSRIRNRWDILQSEFLRVDKRTTRKLDKVGRERLKAIGNGFPPPVMLSIFKAIDSVNNSDTN